MKCRFRPIVLPGGRSAGTPERPRLTRSSLRVVTGSAPDIARALDETFATARRMREETERRRARSPDASPDDAP